MTPTVQSSLPAVDAVEVVDLADVGFHIHRVSEYMTAATTSPFIRLRGAEAEHIAGLWRELQPAEQKRCHVPPFGLRFYAKGKLLCEASICWRCNNVHGRVNGHELFFEFDGSSPAARHLLTACEQALGREAPAE